MNSVTICEDITEPSSWSNFEFEGDVATFLKAFFDKWPESARVYHSAVASTHDVTPSDEGSLKRLQSLSGHFYVVVYPEGWTIIIAIIAIAIAAVSIALSFLLRPSANVKNQQQQSPNNELANRENKPRPGERVPDIYGQVWATPDLIEQPYRIFDGTGVEIEYCYMCLGRGYYTIQVVRDDITPIGQIVGSSVEVYAPFTSPNSGTPQLVIGAAIGEPVRTVKPLNAVNGQILIAPNLTGGGNVVGAFIVGDKNTTQLWCNFIAQSGIYKIDSATGNQSAQSVTLQVGVTPCDAAGNATGATVTHNITLTGSATLKDRVGGTLKITLPAAGIYNVAATRTSNTVIAANTSISDETQWRDCLAIAPVANTDFGDVTTVMTKTLPTPVALGLKARKLNMLVTRSVTQITNVAGVVTYSGMLKPSVDMVDIINAIATDSIIGNRQPSELDLLGMMAVRDAIIAYFGTSLCTQFSYTFDDSKVTFEEMLADIAAATFCTAYRRGSIISLYFEAVNNNSRVLFNHRNKIPLSEARTLSFGTLNDNDGIELTYIDPNAPNFPSQDSQVTLYYPADKSAKNAKKVQTVGIRNNVQAWLIGWRYYQKLLYQNTTTEFEATQEASDLILQYRILVADNTRADTQDGEILEQNILILHTSQKVIFDGGRAYTIFLQHFDGSVESIAISKGVDDYHVVLAQAPALVLVTEDEKFAKTTYQVVSDAPVRSSAFLVSEKTPKSNWTYDVKAVNYDDRYYSHDQDFNLGLVLDTTGDTSSAGLPIAPGAVYRPSTYNDTGLTPTTSPTNAYDGSVVTFAVVTGNWISQPNISLPGYPGHANSGQCFWQGFASIVFTADVFLYIKWTNAAHDGGLTVFGTSSFVGTIGGYDKYKINAGVNIQGVQIEGGAGADPVNTSNSVDVYDIYIQ